MPDCTLWVGSLVLELRWERTRSPRSCSILEEMLPLRGAMRQARWSGEAGWVPLGDAAGCSLPVEHALRYPAPGEVLFYGGGLSEAELLVPYGSAAFACRAGPLAGNHVLTVIDAAGSLRALGDLLEGGSRTFLLDRYAG